jgi:hypothetical protein
MTMGARLFGVDGVQVRHQDYALLLVGVGSGDDGDAAVSGSRFARMSHSCDKAA